MNVSKNSMKGQPTKKGNQPSAALLAAKKRAQQQKNTSSEILIDDPYQVAEDSKNFVKGQTAIITDPRMADHLCLWDKNYPECPERLTRTVQRCKELGLLDRCIALDSQSAEEGDITVVHTKELLQVLKDTRHSNDVEMLEKLSSDYDAIYIHPTSYDMAILAAGSAISLVEAVCTGKAQNGMALIRPPGHHAMESEFCGYCFFNNAAVAVNRALNEGWAKRVLIVDWDVHHGQASQQAFYSDPRVLYFSIHRYEKGKFWPNLKESNFHYIGEDQGLGYNVNIPLDQTGMGDADYLAIFQQVLLPIAHGFQPDLVVISAGYDAALGCPEFAPDLLLISAGYDSALGDEKGEMMVTPACYAHLINLLSVFARGKLVALLEGGYCLSSLSESAAMTLRALLGDPCPSLGPLPGPCDSIQLSLLNTIYTLRPYWDVFKYHPSLSDKDTNVQLQLHVPKVTYLGPSEPDKKPFPTRNCYPIQSEQFKASVQSKLNTLISEYNLVKIATHKVGLVYHDGMLAHRNEYEPGHVESPERASGIFAKHEEYNLIERCHRIEARKVKEEELLMIHSVSHILRIQETKGKSAKDLVNLAESFNSIYLHPETCNSAELAAGCVLEAVDAVLLGTCQSAVAIVRPPGHHAEHDNPCGFCLFNNVALAAKHAVTQHKLQRVLLLDWDVHHGNGTQQIFVDDPRVMYVSIHRYDNGCFFPASMSATAKAESAPEFVGTGPGKGYSINVAWNKRGMSDGDYIAAFLQVILPIVYQFDPELVLISAGFDAAIRDPLGGCKVSPEMYGQMTRWLQGLAGGRVVLALEGGYNVSSIAYSLTMCTKALLGDPIAPVRAASPCPSAINSIRTTQKAQSPFWSSLSLYNRAIPAKDCLVKPGSYKPVPVMEDLADTLSTLKLADTSFPENNPQDADRNNASNPDQPGCSYSQSESEPDSSNSGTSANVTTSKTLKEYLTECLKSGEEMYVLMPRSDCPHLEQIQPIPEGGIDMTSECQSCDNRQENWICLICYTVHCGRYVNAHMQAHSEDTQHPLVLSQADLSVWCYGCDTYVDASVLYEAKNSAHRFKFGVDMPWTYDTIEMT